MPSLLDEFLQSEVRTAACRDFYLGPAHNVRAGHHSELDATGNAFTVTFSSDGALIEHLWNDDAAPLQLTLDEFIAALSAWPTRA